MAIPAMMQALDRLVISENGNFSWTDRKGRIANYYARSIEPSSLDLMLNQQHLLDRPGEMTFQMHSCSDLVTGNVDKFRATMDLERTVTWNEIWKRRPASG